MRVRLRVLGLVFMYAASILTPFTYLIEAAPAHANGEQYAFYYDDDNKGAIAKALRDQNNNVFESAAIGVLGDTAVYAKGGFFGDTPWPFTLSPANAAGNLGGVNGQPTYEASYFCHNGRIYQAADYATLKGHSNSDDLAYDSNITLTVALAAAAKLPTNDADLDSASVFHGSSVGLAATWANPAYAGTNAGAPNPTINGSGTQKIPSSCYPPLGTKNVQNYATLSDSAQKDWGDLKTSSEVSVENNAANNAPAASNPEDACMANADANGFEWIICPVIDTVQHYFAKNFQKFISGTLHVSTPSTSDPAHQIWENIRDVANAAFVLIFLIIIFYTATGLKVDAYTIKKMLPKLIVAAILVQFSYVICQLMLDIGNVIGDSIGALMHVVGVTTVNSTDPGAVKMVYIVGTVLTFILVAASFAIVGVVPILAIAITAIFGAIAIVGTLIVRKLLIMTLVMFAPLAFVAMVLPNTEKIFKMWYSNFTKLILMYPIIAILFSVANVLAGGFHHTGFNAIIASAFPIIACFMVPMTFKWAGGMFNYADNEVRGRIEKGGKATKGAWEGSKFANAAQQNRAIKKNDRMMARLNGEPGFITSRLPDRMGGYLADKKKGAAERWATGKLRRPGQNDARAQRQLTALREADMLERQKLLQGTGKAELQKQLDAAVNSGNHTQAMAISRHMLDEGTLDGAAFGKLMGMQKTPADRARVRDELRNSNYGKFKQNMLAYHVANQDDLATVGAGGEIALGSAALDKLHSASADQLLNVNLDGQEILQKATVRESGVRTIDGQGAVNFNAGDSVVNGGANGKGVYGDTVKNTMDDPQNRARVSQGHRDTFNF